MATMARGADAPLHFALARGAVDVVKSQPRAFVLTAQAPRGVSLHKKQRRHRTLFGTFTLAGREYVCAAVSSTMSSAVGAGKAHESQGRDSKSRASANRASDDDFAHAPDQLVIDANGDRHLTARDYHVALQRDDEAESDASVLHSAPQQITLHGAPGAEYFVSFEVRQVTNWTLDGVQTQWRASLRSVGWQTGALQWNGRAVAAGVQDENSNGRFDDAFQPGPRPSGDLMFFDWNGDGQFRGSREVLRGCRYLFAGWQLRAVTIAPGGTRLSLGPVPGVTGLLRCDPSIGEVHLSSEQGLLVAPLQNGTAALPQDAYAVLVWTARQAAPDGVEWEIKAGNASISRPPRVVIGAQAAECKLLSPLQATLSADRQSEGLRFTLVLGTANGDSVLRLAPRGQEPVPPQLRLFDREGNPVARLRLASEGQASFGVFWRPPGDAPDVLRARLELETGPFALQDTPDWEFSK